MEAIREYLHNMFLNLPETPQVLRAKAELMEMMEDKYEELMQEGMSEKEAVGTVISEFGNLVNLRRSRDWRFCESGADAVRDNGKLHYR